MLESDPDRFYSRPMFAQIEQPGVGSTWRRVRLGEFSAFERAPATRRLDWSAYRRSAGRLLGLSAGQIGQLHDKGVIAGPEAP